MGRHQKSLSITALPLLRRLQTKRRTHKLKLAPQHDLLGGQVLIQDRQSNEVHATRERAAAVVASIPGPCLWAGRNNRLFTSNVSTGEIEDGKFGQPGTGDLKGDLGPR